MSKPKHKDAMVMLELGQLHAAMGVGEAFSWVFSDAYIPEHEKFLKKYPFGSPEYMNVNKVLGFFETVGTLWHHGLINEQLLFDWIAVHMVWDKVGKFALGAREKAGEPRLYEYFEAMTNAQRKTWDKAMNKPKKAKESKKAKEPKKAKKAK